MAPHEFAIDGFSCQMWQVRKKATHDESPLCLVVCWQENCGVASVSLGGEPEFDAIGGVIDRKESKALFKGQFVFCPVVLVHVAPIAGLVPLNAKQDVVLRQLAECVRRGYDLAKPKSGDGEGLRAHVTPPATIS